MMSISYLRIPHIVPILPVVVGACLTPFAWGATYYVGPAGNDTAAGSRQSPWKTLQHAVETIAPGDTIGVLPGTYAGCRIEISGKAGAPKTLKADVEGTVIVSSPGPKNRHGSNIEVENFSSTVSYWIIDGLDIRSAPRSGVDLRDTDHITVQNCRVRDSGRTGIFTAFSYHPAIQDNESAHNGEHGIYQSNSGDHPVIRGNRLHHNRNAGIHLNGDRHFQPGDGLISYALIERNVIWENGVGGASGINCDGMSDSILRNNLLYQNHASGISLYAIDGSQGSSRNLIYNNTIVMAEDSRWVINIPASSSGISNPVGNRIKNNILLTANPRRGSILTYSSSVPGFESDFNVLVDRFAYESDNGQRILGWQDWQTDGRDRNSLLAQPEALFVDPTAGDYRLKAGSSAIDRGTVLPEVLSDIAGTSRPQGASFDLGAYELEAEAVVPPLYVPHVVEGDFDGQREFRTEIEILNLAGLEVSVEMDLVSDDPRLPFSPFQSKFTVEPLGSRLLSVKGGPALTTGWARIVASGPVALTATLQLAEKGSAEVIQSASIPVEPVRQAFFMFARISGRTRYGLALLNPSAEKPADIRFQLLNADGSPAAIRSLQLAPHSRMAQFLDEAGLFADLSDFTGSLEVTSTQPLAATVVRMDGSHWSTSRVFSPTLP